MAKGRMIDRKIRASQTFARFTYRQRDLWQGLIVVADDQGRLPGNPAYIRSTVWPYDDITIADTVADLEAIEKAGNVVRYVVNGCEYLQLVNWHSYQIEAAWLGKSDYPAPPGWIDHCRYHTKGNEIVLENWDTRGIPNGLPSGLPSPLPSRDVNSDINGNNDNNGDCNNSGGISKNLPKQSNIFILYEQNIGPITPLIADNLKAAEKDYPADWIVDAFQAAVNADARNWNYVYKVLENRRKGVNKPHNNNGSKQDIADEWNKQQLAQIEAAKDEVLKDWRP